MKKKKKNRNNVAKGMIESGTGKSAGPMKDRRTKRNKDRKKSWKNEDW